MIWRYAALTVREARKDAGHSLSSLGKDGWEAFAVSDGVIYLKRPAPVSVTVTADVGADGDQTEVVKAIGDALRKSPPYRASLDALDEAGD